MRLNPRRRLGAGRWLALFAALLSLLGQPLHVLSAPVGQDLHAPVCTALTGSASPTDSDLPGPARHDADHTACKLCSVHPASLPPPPASGGSASNPAATARPHPLGPDLPPPSRRLAQALPRAPPVSS